MVNKLKLKSGFIEFKNYSSQIPAPFKIDADFECILNRVKSNEKISGYYTKKYQDYILCSFANKLVCVNKKFSKPVVLYTGEKATYNFITIILQEFDYCKKVMEKHCNKNLIMAEKEESFQSSNTNSICEKLIHDQKVRDHCHITGK